jgi:ferredoxin-NADP reductase
LIINGISYTRSYSLSSCPDEDEKSAVTVKRVEGGIVSNFIFEHVEDINE